MFFFYTKMPYYVFKHYSGVIYLYMFLTVSPVCMFYDANNVNEKKNQKRSTCICTIHCIYMNQNHLKAINENVLYLSTFCCNI